MPTPTDPYSSSSNRPFEEDILAPIPEGTTADAAAEAEPIVPTTTSAQEQRAIDAAAKAEAGKAPTAAEIAAEPAPQGPTVVGSLTHDEPKVQVENAEIPNAFEASASEGAPAAKAKAPAQPAVRSSSPQPRPEATLADGSGYAAQDSAEPAPETAAQPAVTRKSVMDNSTAPLDRALDVSPLTAASASDVANPFEAPAEPAAESWEPAPPQIEAIPEGPKSRVGAHIGILFATLVLVPLAWYLLSDSSIRLAFLEGSQWESGKVAIPVLLETIGALIVTGLIWFLARASSLGAFIWGLVLTVLGAIGVVVPYFARNTIASWVNDHIAHLNTLTGNVAHHFSADLGSGRILFFGFLLLMTSVVSHYARKRGNLAGVQTTRRAVALNK